jgi:hypothetical protein
MVSQCDEGQKLLLSNGDLEAVNKVKGVNESFIDHCDVQRLCYVGWGPILKKHFKSLLA